HGLWRPYRREGLGRLLDRKRGPRQAAEREAAGQSVLDNADAKRGHRPIGVDVPDLGRTDLHAVVVELVTQEEPARLALVEADRDHPAAATRRPDGFLERTTGAGALEDDRDGVRAQTELELARNIHALRREDRVEAMVLGDLEPRADAVDDVNLRGARRERELGHDEANGAGAEDDRGRTDE